MTIILSEHRTEFVARWASRGIPCRRGQSSNLPHDALRGIVVPADGRTSPCRYVAWRTLRSAPGQNGPGNGRRLPHHLPRRGDGARRSERFGEEHIVETLKRPSAAESGRSSWRKRDPGEHRRRDRPHRRPGLPACRLPALRGGTIAEELAFAPANPATPGRDNAADRAGARGPRHRALGLTASPLALSVGEKQRVSIASS